MRRTPLYYAIVNLHPAAADALLGAGADANATDINGESVLLAAFRTQQEPLCLALLKKLPESVVLGGDTAYGANPILWAAQGGMVKVTEYLLKERGERPTQQDYLGFSPLHIAAMRNDVSLATALLPHCCDGECGSLQDRQNRTARDVAAAEKATEVLHLIDDPKAPVCRYNR